MASYQSLTTSNSSSESSPEQAAKSSHQDSSGGDADVNPFAIYPPFTKWDYLKIAINALWLAPLRFFLLVLPSIIMGGISATIITMCEHFDEENPQPLMGWRRFYLQRICPKISRLFLFGFGFQWIHTRGELADSREAPILVVAPHSSLLDTFVIGAYHIPTFVGRTETRRTPIFGCK